MIAIINIGPAPGNKRRGAPSQPIDPLGPHLYQVKINAQPKAVFTHTRGDSLETCLRKAADAVALARAKEILRLSALLSE